MGRIQSAGPGPGIAPATIDSKGYISSPGLLWDDNVASGTILTIPSGKQFLGLYTFYLNGDMIIAGTFMVI